MHLLKYWFVSWYSSARVQELLYVWDRPIQFCIEWGLKRQAITQIIQMLGLVD